MAKISIIIPVYNTEKYLARCVDSILAQTFKDYELILVNDGSPDNCPKICDEYAAKYDFIKVIHQDNQGAATARNAGIECALKTNSEWITFIDSDDWVLPQYLEILYNACIKNNVDISCCGLNRSTERLKHENNQISEAIICSPENYFCKYNGLIFSSCCKLFLKKLWSNIRFPDGKLYEDAFTIYKVLFSVCRLVYINNDLYYYFYREGGLTHCLWTQKHLDEIIAHKEEVEFFYKNGFYNAYKKEIVVYIKIIVHNLNETKKIKCKTEYKSLRKLLKKEVKIYREEVHDLPQRIYLKFLNYNNLNFIQKILYVYYYLLRKIKN